MIFDIYIKDGENYKFCQIAPPSGCDLKFFKSLQMTIDENINKIRNDIHKYCGETTCISKPKVDDYETQKIIDKLVEMRNLELRTREKINTVIKGSEFIVCFNCGEKMYKTPVNTAFEKIGNGFILKNGNEHIQYNYKCCNCNRFIEEEIHERQRYLRELREKLIAQGKTWLPDEFGFWSGQPEINDGCRHVYKRTFEQYKLMIDGVEKNIAKIQDKCVYCGETISIK